jgi:acyl dehydratase
MPLNSNTVGASTQPMEHVADARWLMAYAAGLNDLNPKYMDTSAHKVVGHPVFPVCLEWPVILNTREIVGAQSLTSAEASRGVHAAHDLHIYRPVCSGDVLTTQATMIGVKAIRPGAAYTMRLDTCDANSGDLVARTYQLGIYRGVNISGEPQACEAAPAPPPTKELGTTAQSFDLQVHAAAAHTYTECARIWNPIHTDRAVALAAGLPDIILHGTATLAMAVTKLVDHYADSDPARVKRLGGRFSAMVLMPSTITVKAHKAGNIISYLVLNEAGETAISQGFLVLSQ